MGIQTKGRGIQTVKGAYQTEGEGVAKKMKKIKSSATCCALPKAGRVRDDYWVARAKAQR